MANKKKPQYYEQKEKKRKAEEEAARAAEEPSEIPVRKDSIINMNMWGISIGAVIVGLIGYFIGENLGNPNVGLIVGLVIGAIIGMNMKRIVKLFKKGDGDKPSS